MELLETLTVLVRTAHGRVEQVDKYHQCVGERTAEGSSTTCNAGYVSSRRFLGCIFHTFLQKQHEVQFRVAVSPVPISKR